MRTFNQTVRKLLIALTGHSGIHTAQSMQPSGSMAKKLSPATKQSAGQTSTQSVYLHRMQDSVTTKVMPAALARQPPQAPPEQQLPAEVSAAAMAVRVMRTCHRSGPDCR